MNAQVLVFRQSLPAGKSAALRRDNEIDPLKWKDFQTKGCNEVIKLSASVLDSGLGSQACSGQAGLGRAQPRIQRPQV